MANSDNPSSVSDEPPPHSPSPESPPLHELGDAGIASHLGAESEGLVDVTPECPICYQFFMEPLTPDCGHTFCRACLLSCTRLAPDGRNCPICRVAITIRDPVAHAVDREVVEAVLDKVGAEAYEARRLVDQARVEALVKQADEMLPIFAMAPGGRVGGQVALHFFEPRYKILIRRAWEGNRMFVFAPQAPRPGLRAVVVEIYSAAFAHDGRANIRGIGVASIKLGEVWVEEGTCGLACTRVRASELPEVAYVDTRNKCCTLM